MKHSTVAVYAVLLMLTVLNIFTYSGGIRYVSDSEGSAEEVEFVLDKCRYESAYLNCLESAHLEEVCHNFAHTASLLHPSQVPANCGGPVMAVKTE